MADSKTPVPKFASFRPKATKQAETHSHLVDTALLNNEENDAIKNRRIREGKHNNESHERERGRRRDRSSDKKSHSHARQEPGHELTSTNAIEISKELFENASDIYRVDRKGDPDNLRYRGLHKYSIPPYKRIGYGAVLGAPWEERIDRTFPEDKGIVLARPERDGKARRSLLHKQVVADKKKLRLIRPDTDHHDHFEFTESFIQLPKSSRKRKCRSESPNAEQNDIDYRSIEGEAKPLKQATDSDLESASSSDAELEYEDENRAARIRNAELSRRTRDHPQDLDAWLALIEHQRLVLGFGAGDLSHAKMRTLADIRISIYEQALAVVKSPQARARLTLGMLEEGSKLWEAKMLAKKWEEALRMQSNDLSIWMAYLRFIQSSHAEFRYERCRDEYIKGLEILGKTLAKAETAADSADIARNLVYVFLRLTCMMRDSGYHEFSIALWQAVLELHFFRPTKLQDDEGIAQAFEEFWESEVPRLGEEHAKGWLNYLPEQDETPDPQRVEISQITSARRLFKRFAEAEQAARSKMAFPGRSADEAGEDDPYHIVFFNDLKTVLFPHTLRLPAGRDLIVAFLLFWGLPPLPLAESREYDSWWLDPMLQAKANPETLVRHSQCTTDILFGDGFLGLDEGEMRLPRRTLRSLVDMCPIYMVDVLAEYYIALEYHFEPESASKIAKRLLKRHSSSLRLYNCYAILESRTKGTAAGGRIFSTAIAMADSLAHNLKIVLYRTWIWEALRAEDANIATGILLSVDGDSKDVTNPIFSPAVELRVTRWLRDEHNAMLSAGEVHLAVLHAELLALLAYFKSERSIEAALKSFDETEQALTSRKLVSHPAHEVLHQAKTQLIAFHLKSVHIWRPALIRDSLAHSIRLFPNNTLFLSEYQKIGPDLNVHGPHSLLEDVVLVEGKDSIIGWSFVLKTGLQRGLELGGTVHAVRATFERAVSHSGRHSIHIWTHYLLFELQRKEYKKAKDVFLRGLRELPWAKWWVILGLDKLGDVVGFEDGRKIWSVLGERELRVHLNVEELVEDERAKRRRAEEKELLKRSE
ncbi:uncharacterized protein PV09_04059 [Verruconis gallopava]|uniref:DUF1740-domain-containing protein n=1 Tax=Verruconis gallopava TaxID=253628 RepID=A0A0D2B0K9_9PEZI|nr:uncharacterized protein PV09_04059 [Verruconis gallopava]KIW04884.1 hypothetical protein PV09_04059 [Verruconis gallopava]